MSSSLFHRKIHLKDDKIALNDIESDFSLFQYDFRLNLKLSR